MTTYETALRSIAIAMASIGMADGEPNEMTTLLAGIMIDGLSLESLEEVAELEEIVIAVKLLNALGFLQVPEELQ